MPVPTNVPRSSDASVSESKNIWIAAGEGDLDRVKECIDVEGISPTAADEFTYTPLHAAASYRHLDVLRYLLSHPSAPSDAVNVTDSDDETPLFVCETVDVARCLIEEFGADARHKNQDGYTPAYVAEENQHSELATYLRSVTGESAIIEEEEEDAEEEDENGVPRSQAPSLLQPGEADIDDEEDRELDEKADQLMAKVEDIMTRAEREGFDPEDELRKVVSESVLRQILEGLDQPPQSSQEASSGQTL